MHLVLARKGLQSKGLSSKGVISSPKTAIQRRKPSAPRRKPCPSFIGKPKLHHSAVTSWFWNKKVKLLLRRFKICLGKEENLCPLTVKDLARANDVVPAGAVEAGVVVHARNPSEFYIVLENSSYYSSPQLSEWKNFFPGFKSGPETFCGIHALLDLFFKSYTALGINFDASGAREREVGDLVAVKVIRKLKSSEEKEPGVGIGKVYEYQIRRGVVMEVDDSKNIPEFTVYLLDVGCEVTVSNHFLLSLPKPFNHIPPLAFRCSLYGLSPVGEDWNEIAVQYFRDLLQKHKDAKFCFEFCSIVAPPLRTTDVQSLVSSYLVNAEISTFNFKTVADEYLLNFSEEIIKNMHAITWNLMPTRPKLMEGTSIPDRTFSHPVREMDRLTVSLRTGLLLTKCHPRFYNLMRSSVLKREIEKLFRMRGHNLTDVEGMHNHLMIILQDPDKKFGEPSSVSVSYEKTWKLNELKEEEADKRMNNKANKAKKKP